MRAHFRHLSFNSFPMIWKTLQANGFWPLHSPFENSRIHWDYNSQNGSSFGSVKVHSLTFLWTPKSMRCDPGLPSWPTTLQAIALVASPRLRLQHHLLLQIFVHLCMLLVSLHLYLILSLICIRIVHFELFHLLLLLQENFLHVLIMFLKFVMLYTQSIFLYF